MELILRESGMLPCDVGLLPRKGGQMLAIQCYASHYIGFIHIYDMICDVDAISLDLTAISNKSITEQKAGC